MEWVVIRLDGSLISVPTFRQIVSHLGDLGQTTPSLGPRFSSSEGIDSKSPQSGSSASLMELNMSEV